MEKIGDLINNEIRKQNWKIKDFAEKINTSRGNVYKIIDKGSLDVGLLGTISKVLNHNFFEDIAKNMELVTIEDSEVRERDRAITQFMDVVPKVMKELGREAMIHIDDYSDCESELPLPDYIMIPYGVTFTYGETYKQKLQKIFDEYPQLLHVVEDGKGNFVEIIETLGNTQMCNVLIKYRSEEEGKELMIFTLQTINKYYSPYNKYNLERSFNRRIIW